MKWIVYCSVKIAVLKKTEKKVKKKKIIQRSVMQDFHQLLWYFGLPFQDMRHQFEGYFS